MKRVGAIAIIAVGILLLLAQLAQLPVLFAVPPGENDAAFSAGYVIGRISAMVILSALGIFLVMRGRKWLKMHNVSS